MNDEETAHIDISNIHDLTKVTYYLQIKNIEKDGYVPLLKLDPYIEIVYVPTPKKTEQLKRTLFVKCFGEDSRDITASLSDFNVNTANRKRALKIANQIVSGVEQRGIYIHSKEFQIGKTYLANAITNALIDKGIHGSFLFSPSFARQAKEFDSLEERIRTLNASELLVIDDIGAEYNSKWFRTEVLMPVLQHRLTNNKLTIFTSNYSIAALADLYGDSIDTERLITRIVELADEIKIDEYNKV